MKQSTVDFCFANLVAFKRRPRPDRELSVTCGGPAGPRPSPWKGRETSRKERNFLCIPLPAPLLTLRPLGSVANLDSDLPLPPRPEPTAHFLGDRPPAPLGPPGKPSPPAAPTFSLLLALPMNHLDAGVAPSSTTGQRVRVVALGRQRGGPEVPAGRRTMGSCEGAS